MKAPRGTCGYCGVLKRRHKGFTTRPEDGSPFCDRYRPIKRRRSAALGIKRV